MKGKIFNAQEVKAIIAGNKTQFREVCLFQPTNELAIDALLRLYKPYGIGQKIFCKETFAEVEVGAGMGYNTGKAIIRRADDDYDVKWKPAQHMKQEHSRLTLEITNIKVERLQDISEEDAIKEDVECETSEDHPFAEWYDYLKKIYCLSCPSESFATLWNATHKKPEEKFEANPFVWVVDFKVNK